MKKVLAVFALAAFAACRKPSDGISEAEAREMGKAVGTRRWSVGQLVELTGTNWTSKANARYYMKCNDGSSVHLRGSVADNLAVGTRLWVKGQVKYATYCYLTGQEFRILSP